MEREDKGEKVEEKENEKGGLPRNSEQHALSSPLAVPAWLM